METILSNLNRALIETESQLWRLMEQRIAIKNQIAALESAAAKEVKPE